MDTQSVMPTAAPIFLDTESSNHSPVANRTRSHFQKLDIQTDGDCKTSDINSVSLTTVETVSSDTPQPINELKSNYPLVLQLPEDLSNVNQHYVNFVRCEDVHSANTVKKCMEQQWSTLVQPGRKVKVKVKEEVVSAVVEKLHFISKLSFDCRYFYATAKADIILSGCCSPREYQLREFILL